jgi:site-specific recombinase XerD
MNDLPVPVCTGASLTITDELTSAAAYARASKADATLRAYRSDLRDFVRWCATHALDPMPASPATVAAYLAALADSGLKASTITRRAAALTSAHRSAGFPPPTASDPVKAVLKGIRRSIGVAPSPKSPATARTVSRMVAKCPDTVRGKRDRALLLLGFAAALRRSELAALNIEDLERTNEGMIVHIRRSKTDQDGTGQSVAVPFGSKLKPVDAVDAWLEASGRKAGSLFGLCDKSVALIVKRYARKAKLDPTLFAGHSLRAGFVTEALERGADLLKVMDVTRHREVKTLKVYDRRAKAFRNHAGKGFL